MSKILRTYIGQLKNDGTSQNEVNAVDILDVYRMATEDFPLVYLPNTKSLTVKKWNDEDGEEVYIPQARRLEAYDLTIKFLYVGNEETFRGDLEGFIDFLYGRNANATGSRLAIYDEHVKDGKKDITVKEVSTNMFFFQDNDSDILAEFSVVFRVHNPVTKVSYNPSNKKLVWQQG